MTPWKVHSIHCCHRENGGNYPWDGEPLAVQPPQGAL